MGFSSKNNTFDSSEFQQRAEENVNRGIEKTSEKAEQMKQSAAEMKEQAAAKATEGFEQAKYSANEMKHKAGEKAEQAKESAIDMKDKAVQKTSEGIEQAKLSANEFKDKVCEKTEELKESSEGLVQKIQTKLGLPVDGTLGDNIGAIVDKTVDTTIKVANAANEKLKELSGADVGEHLENAKEYVADTAVTAKEYVQEGAVTAKDYVADSAAVATKEVKTRLGFEVHYNESMSQKKAKGMPAEETRGHLQSNFHDTGSMETQEQKASYDKVLEDLVAEERKMMLDEKY